MFPTCVIQTFPVASELKVKIYRKKIGVIISHNDRVFTSWNTVSHFPCGQTEPTFIYEVVPIGLVKPSSSTMNYILITTTTKRHIIKTGDVLMMS